MKRAAWLALAVALWAAPADAAVDLSAGDPIGHPPGLSDIVHQRTTSTFVTRGAVYTLVSLATASDGPIFIYQLTVNMRTPGLRISSVQAHDGVMGGGESVSSMAARTGAIAGINGDYFGLDGLAAPYGMTVQDGRLLRNGNSWGVFGIGWDNKVSVDKYAWKGLVRAFSNASEMPLEAVNFTLPDEGLAEYSSEMSSRIAGRDVTVARLAPVDPSEGRYVVKALAQHQSFSSPPEAGETLLAGQRAAGQWLAHVARVGDLLDIVHDTSPDWRDLRLAMGGGPILVKDGESYFDYEQPSPTEYDMNYPVVGVGADAGGSTFWMVVVHGPKGYSGFTRPQFAWYFREIGAANAIAFDSGGSVTMAIRKPGDLKPSVVNDPSDGAQRRVANGLFLYAHTDALWDLAK